MSVQEATTEQTPATPITTTRTLPKVATATATLRDLFIVTWAIPEAAARTLVPEGIVLDRLPNSEGELQAFVQFVFALREDARWSPLPSQWGNDYHEATLQVLTRTHGERSAYVVKHFTGNSRVAGTLFPFTKAVEEGHFHVYVAGDPARQTFEKLGIKITTDAVQVHLRGEVSDTPETTPVGRWHDAVAFLTERPLALHPARLPKEAITLFKTEHLPLVPRAVKLTHRVLRPLDTLALGEPILALYQAELTVTAHGPKRQHSA